MGVLSENLLGQDSAEMDEQLLAVLVDKPLIANFVKNANKARVEGIENFVRRDNGEPFSSWEEFMWHEIGREQSGTIADFVLDKNGMTSQTVTQRKQALVRRLIEDYKDKEFDEILYLLS
jgi:hypothetical protein